MIARSFAVASLVGSSLALTVALTACPTVPTDTGEPPDAVAGLRINEVAAAGVPADWFELTNVGDDDVSLDDVTFTDDAASPDKGVFPAGVVVAPGDHVVVDVDDATVGFKIASDEALHVFAEEGGALVDEIDWVEGASPAGGSLARVPDGDGDFETVTPDTRGAAND